MAVKRKSRGSRKPRRSSRSSRRSTKLVDPSAKRVGSPHEEHIRGLGSYCNVCGYIDDANPSDPLIRKWHSDSFGDSRRPSQWSLWRCEECGAEFATPPDPEAAGVAARLSPPPPSRRA